MTDTQSQAAPTQPPAVKEVELSIKVNEVGEVSWHIPKNLERTNHLMTILRLVVDDMNRAQLKQAMRPNHPNIITSLKDSPLMRKVFR